MRHKILWALAAILLSLVFSPEVVIAKSAASACYGPTEVKAEQTIRLHSELMVITVTCRQNTMGRDLPRAYAKFTTDNISILHDAEQVMKSWYKKTYGGDSQLRLDRLRTVLANEYGQEAATLTAPLFCAQRRDKVTAMCDAQPVIVTTEIGNMCARIKTLISPCINGQASTKGRG